MKNFRRIAIIICTTLYYISISSIKIQNVQAVILAAGKGSRFKTDITKLVYPICDRAVVAYPVTLMEQLGINSTVIVGHQQDKVKAVINASGAKQVQFAEQKEQKGTGHALMCSEPTWNTEHILVLNGDGPMLTKEIITTLCDEHIQSGAAISFIVSYFVDPASRYGRLVKNDGITKIVEAKHFTYTMEDYPYINAGIYLISRAFLEEFLSSVEQNEQTCEFYITDLVEIASKNNLVVKTIEVPFDATRGINTLKELSDAQKIKQAEIIEYWMLNGVHFNNPDTTYVGVNVEIAAGTFIDSGVQLKGKTKIGQNCHIAAYSILEDTVIEDNTTIEAFSVIKH